VELADADAQETPELILLRGLGVGWKVIHLGQQRELEMGEARSHRRSRDLQIRDRRCFGEHGVEILSDPLGHLLNHPPHGHQSFGRAVQDGRVALGDDADLAQ
jgi:hypothetical protein